MPGIALPSLGPRLCSTSSTARSDGSSIASGACPPPLPPPVFALEPRVRPFNKWLRHEIAARPLALAGLIPLVDRMAMDPTPTTQREAFRLIEAAAPGAGPGGGAGTWA